MKQVFRFLTFCLLFSSILSLAQAPQKFSYQAVARDATGNPLANTDISVRMNINNGMPLEINPYTVKKTQCNHQSVWVIYSSNWSRHSNKRHFYIHQLGQW